MDKSIGFIGGGRITNIFLQAYINKGIELDSVFVHDTNPAVLKKLKEFYPFINQSELIETAKQEVVFIALHPPVIKDVLSEIKDVVTKDTIIISLAPKITIEKLSSALNNKNIVRMIPNATSVINEGINPVCFSETCIYKKELLDFLSELGYTFETEESKLEAYAIISAMLPTYFWFQWKEIIDIGTQIGLSGSESNLAVQKTLKASMNTLFKSTLSEKEIFDLIPVKPIGDHESEITEIYRKKLLGLFDKIKP